MKHSKRASLAERCSSIIMSGVLGDFSNCFTESQNRFLSHHHNQVYARHAQLLVVRHIVLPSL